MGSSWNDETQETYMRENVNNVLRRRKCLMHVLNYLENETQKGNKRRKKGG